MNPWDRLPADWIKPDDFVTIIEISKGSKQKYEVDERTGLLQLDRILFTSTHYPANYGFVPQTLADDDDPLDVLVLCSEILAPLCMVRCHPLGVLTMRDNNQNDEKIIAVPFKDPQMSGYQDISQLPTHLFEEIQHFFTVYKELEGIRTDVIEVGDREMAAKVFQRARDAYVPPSQRAESDWNRKLN